MNKHTYLVLEIHPAYAIALEDNGRIVRIANLGLEVGERTDSVIEM